jgi:uncharacterized OB-fold protein
MSSRKYKAIKEDLFSTPLLPLESVCLKGVKCRNCNETFFGHRRYCQNCGSSNLKEIVLSRRGKLFSYTIARYPPPGDYKGPRDPYVPFAIGSVELPEGLRIIAPLTDCNIDSLEVDMPVELVIESFYRDEHDCEVIRYAFKPV